jgi:hypothetical protein
MATAHCGRVSPLATASRVAGCSTLHRDSQRQAFQLPQPLRTLGGVLGHIAYEGEVLAVESAGRQREQERCRTHQRRDGDAQFVRRAHHRRSGVGDGRHACFAEQAEVVPLQRRSQQRACVEAAGVVALLVDFARQLDDVLFAQGPRQRVRLGNAIQAGASSLGVLADPVRDRGRLCQRSVGHDLGERHLLATAEVQRGRHQEQPAALGRVHRMRTPAARSMRQVRIKGRPTKAVGSSLSMACSNAMPSPSLRALPAQS